MAEPAPAPAPAAVAPRRFHAAIRHARISPRKIRYVTALIRGRSLNRAKEIIAFTDKRGARFVNKLLDAVIANVTHLNQEKDLDVDVNRLAIQRIWADPAPTWKRITAAPMGRALPIKKRNCHIHVVVAESEAERGDARRERRVRASQAAASQPNSPTGETKE